MEFICLGLGSILHPSIPRDALSDAYFLLYEKPALLPTFPLNNCYMSNTHTHVINILGCRYMTICFPESRMHPIPVAEYC